MNERARRRLRGGPLSLGACILATSCAMLVDPGAATYLSNRELIRLVSERIGFDVDGRLFELFHAQVREDAVLLYYRGVAYPGDQAWVWRFSRKSSEQSPDELLDFAALAPILEEGRSGFETGEPATLPLDDAVLRYLPYRFDAPVRDDEGVPRAGRGFLGIVERVVRGEPVVFYLNLDNWGDRPELTLDALDPFLAEIAEG